MKLEVLVNDIAIICDFELMICTFHVKIWEMKIIDGKVHCKFKYDDQDEWEVMFNQFQTAHHEYIDKLIEKELLREDT